MKIVGVTMYGMDNNQYDTQQEAVVEKHLLKVTTFSKLLVLILLITLPFIGFWLGIKYMSNPAEVINSAVVLEDETQVVENVEIGRCESIYHELRPQPTFDNTVYAIIHSDNDGIVYNDKDQKIYPYSKECKVSLVKTNKENGVESTEVVIEDLVSLMLEQGVGNSLSGLPRPYIFYRIDATYPSTDDPEDKLFFGYNNYEGSQSPIYSLDLETLTFIKVISHIGDGQVDWTEDGLMVIPHDNSILRVLDFKTEKLYETTLSDMGSDETIFSSCGMGCASALGWADAKNIWYGVYKIEGLAKMVDQRSVRSANTTFQRVGSIEFDVNKWREVRVEQ